MQIRHVHARSNRATLLGLGQEIVYVGDLHLVSRGEPQGWGVWLTIEVEGVLSITCKCCVQGYVKCMFLPATVQRIRYQPCRRAPQFKPTANRRRHDAT